MAEGDSNPNSGIYVYGLLHDLELRCLIDSGAGRNVLSVATYEKLPAYVQPHLHAPSVRLRGVSGNFIPVAGEADFPIRVGSTTISVPFIVAECMDEAILGMPFLRMAKAKVDFCSFRLELQGEKVPCFDASSRPLNAAVRLAQDVTVAPGEEYVIPGRVHYRGHIGRQAVMEGVTTFARKNSVLIARAVGGHTCVWE